MCQQAPPKKQRMSPPSPQASPPHLHNQISGNGPASATRRWWPDGGSHKDAAGGRQPQPPDFPVPAARPAAGDARTGSDPAAASDRRQLRDELRRDGSGRPGDDRGEIDAQDKSRDRSRCPPPPPFRLPPSPLRLPPLLQD